MKLELQDDAHLIFCKPYTPETAHPLALAVSCEGCLEPVAAFPVSVAKTREDKNFHILCLACLQELIKEHGPIRFAGRVKENRFPEKGKP